MRVEDLQNHQKFMERVKEFFEGLKDRKVKVTVFDHIISNPGYLCPLQEIVKYFKEKEITCFIDGAHAINQVPIDFSAIQPDAYFSNFHKWAYTPKSAAFLYLS